MPENIHLRDRIDTQTHKRTGELGRINSSDLKYSTVN